MKYFLTPFTLIIWFLITYYGIYYSIVLMGSLFSIKWYWLLLIYPFLLGFIRSVVIEVPNLLRMYILKLYNFSWLFIIIHSLFGFLGIVSLAFMFNNFDIAHYVYNNNEVNIFKGMWLTSKVKFIILVIPITFLILSIIHSSVFIPVLTKLEIIKRRNKVY